MRKTKDFETDNKLTVDIDGLQAMLSCGKNTAAQIGEDAGAVIRLGRRKLYLVSSVEAYLNKLVQC